MAGSFVFSVGLEYTGSLFVFLLASIILSGFLLIIEIIEFKLLKIRTVKHIK